MTSKDFKTIRTTLIAPSKLSYLEFRKELKPKYVRVWLDIAIGWTALLSSLALCALAVKNGTPTEDIFVILVGTFCMGYWVAYLQLFVHEAAHFMIAEDKWLNDVLSDLFLGSIIGQSVAAYRPIHFDHHRYIGTSADPERSYFDPLTPKFLLKSMLGIRTLQVILYRRSLKSSDFSIRPKLWNRARVAGFFFHGAIISVLFFTGSLGCIFAWFAGVFLVFPFLAGLRQLLEHRSFSADPKTDFTKINHGETERIFYPGLFSNTFGAAGFNRHLIHHWEPQISYTQLPAVEHFLMSTQCGDHLSSVQTTYGRTFACLLKL